MAFRIAIRSSRNRQCLSVGRISLPPGAPSVLSESLPYVSQQRTYHKKQHGDPGGQHGHQYKWDQSFTLKVGCGIAASAIVAALTNRELKAEAAIFRPSYGPSIDKVTEKESRYEITY